MALPDRPRSRFRTGTFLLAALFAGCSPQSEAAEGSSDPPQSANQPVAQTPPQDIVDLNQLGIDEGSRMTAVIPVVEFSDFGCIYCATFHMNDYPALYEEFVVGGDVLWKYIPITIGGFPNGDLAGLTGICVTDLGPARGFATIRDRLFAEREEWLEATPSDARALFIGYAEDAGVTRTDFEACVDGDDAADRLTTNNEMARRVGVTGTPTFLVQGSPVRGAPPIEDFQRVLREIVADARARMDGGPDGGTSDAPDQ